MKTLISIFTASLLFAGTLLNLTPGSADNSDKRADAEMFEKAVELIKKYETLHQPRHYPLVGYGHLVMPGEKFSRSKAMGEAAAEKLLRKDLLKNCAVFRQYGKDSLILGVLAYNVGSGTVLRSSLLKKIAAGNRDIERLYLSFCKFRGRPHSGLKKRRIEEFKTLFLTDTVIS